MEEFEDQVKKLNIRGIIVTSNLAALSLLIGLLWKDAITDTLAKLLPHSQGLLSLYVTAAVGTVAVVIIAYIMLKAQEINKKHIMSFGEKVKITVHKPGIARRIRDMIELRGLFKYSYSTGKMLHLHGIVVFYKKYIYGNLNIIYKKILNLRDLFSRRKTHEKSIVRIPCSIRADDCSHAYRKRL
jgi:hypothetical protein